MFYIPGFSLKRLLWSTLRCAVWFQASSICNSVLKGLHPQSGWLRWCEWSSSKIGVPVIPAKLLHIALFISELTKGSVVNDNGSSYVKSVLYGIKWGHTIAGIEACPISHPLVKSALEGAKRKLARPVQPKERLSVRTVRAIADHYASSNSFSDVRFLFILLVGARKSTKDIDILSIAFRSA